MWVFGIALNGTAQRGRLYREGSTDTQRRALRSALRGALEDLTEQYRDGLKEARMSDLSDSELVMEILRQAKLLAREYRRLTGKPLGVTGEVAEYEAARILSLRLTAARQEGYDAEETSNGVTRHLQIKGRCILENSKRSQMCPSINILRDFDAVLLVLLDQNLDAFAIYEADRAPVIAALSAPGSRARNERGAMAVSKFKSIAKTRWLRSAA